MSSHFSVLGFLDARRDLDAFFALPAERYVDASGALHALHADASGAAVVAHVVDGTLVCVTPLFRPRTPNRWTLRRSCACIDATCAHCSGVDVDVYGVAPGDPEQFDTRCTLQLACGRAFAERGIGAVDVHAVVAFAHELRAFRDEADLARAQHGKLRLAVPSFLPTGMFGPADDVGARAQAQIVGRVMSATPCVNGVTGGSFLHLVVDGLCGPIDVVADLQDIAAGAVVEISAWLVADDFAAP